MFTRSTDTSVIGFNDQWSAQWRVWSDDHWSQSQTYLWAREHNDQSTLLYCLHTTVQKFGLSKILIYFFKEINTFINILQTDKKWQ